MSTTYQGYAFIQGLGPNCTVGIEGYAQVFVDSLPIVHRAKFDEHIGVGGRTCAFVHSNEHFEISISFRPASNASVAGAEGDLVPIAKGSKVVLSGFKPLKYTYGTPPTEKDILNDTAGWITVGDATLTMNASDPATVDLTLRHHLEAQPSLLTKVV